MVTWVSSLISAAVTCVSNEYGFSGADSAKDRHWRRGGKASSLSIPCLHLEGGRVVFARPLVRDQRSAKAQFANLIEYLKLPVLNQELRIVGIFAGSGLPFCVPVALCKFQLARPCESRSRLMTGATSLICGMTT